MKKRAAGWAWPLAGALLCLALGTASGLSSVGGRDSWYQELMRPPGTPPPWVFGPVWSVLYLMMGVAFGRLLQRRARQATWVFCTQFVLNLVWTPIFFGIHEIAAALAVIGAIWLGVLATVGLAWKYDKISVGLLLPYWLWISYATYLNAGFFWQNS
jgi:translocator protein